MEGPGGNREAKWDLIRQEARSASVPAEEETGRRRAQAADFRGRRNKPRCYRILE
jgi:hypothetical protein